MAWSVRTAKRDGGCGDGKEGRMGTGRSEEDLSRRDRGYPEVPIEHSRAQWEPEAGGNSERGGPGSIRIVAAVVAVLLVLALAVTIFT